MGRFKSSFSKDSGGDDKGFTYDRLPEAEYTATILETSVNDEKQQVSFKLFFPGVVTKDGVSRYKNHSFKSEKAQDLLASQLQRIGYEINSGDDLEKAIDDCVGLQVKVQVKNQADSDKYQNFWFNARVGRDRQLTAVHNTVGKGADKGDGIPF